MIAGTKMNIRDIQSIKNTETPDPATAPPDDGGKKKIALQSWTGKFLSAKPDGTVWACADCVGDWEQ